MVQVRALAWRSPSGAGKKISDVIPQGGPVRTRRFGARGSGVMASARRRGPRAGAASPSSASSSTQTDSTYFAADDRPIILFDGVCNLCNGGVNFVLDWDAKGKLRMAALQSGAGQELLERSGRRRDDISSIVLVEKDQSYVKSQAVLKIAERLSVPFPLLAQFFLPLPLLIRDGVYDQVAANRYFFFGKSDQCRLSDDRFQDRFVD
ncbi:DUF393 domain-containing protein [Chloropicon roscoffensis]|uniref:DUF393 domain-containing protein n=2 Tax=Chloropicon roscoffensis TaxID=1461544 RepID=A0AAX4P3R5_9CHLO